jgi:hypothetical protein
MRTVQPDSSLFLGTPNEELAETVSGGTIGAEERARMVLGVNPRRQNLLLAAFHADGQFRGLVVEVRAITEAPDSAFRL